MELLTEKYDEKKHGYLSYGKDAFGNAVKAEKGFILLNRGVVIQKGDRPFDIYSGWLKGVEQYYAKNHHSTECGGRWTTWERKVPKKSA